jgi:hypothetical protein
MSVIGKVEPMLVGLGQDKVLSEAELDHDEK